MKYHIGFCAIFMMISGNVTAGVSNISSETNQSEDSYNSCSDGVHLACWNFYSVQYPLTLTLMLIIVGLVQIGFTFIPILVRHIPEPCIFILLGVTCGAIFHAAGVKEGPHLTASNFQYYLLPPIVFDNAYSLHDRMFAENLGTILLFAIIGCLLNYLGIGICLWGLSCAGAIGDLSVSLLQALLFSSIISATDPTPMLVIFEGAELNNVVYFLMFGETLNDAVTVPVSNTMKAFNETETGEDIVRGVFSLLTVSVGSIGIGCMCGLLTALYTRVAIRVRVVEPLAVLSMAYLSFLGGELFLWSGVISGYVCGLLQAQYAFHNISRKSYTTVKYFLKMLSKATDSIILVLLGSALVRNPYEWNGLFIVWTLILCLIFRAISIYGLALLANSVKRLHRITWTEQFIMWYSGLRGGVCFALCDTISDDHPHKSIFISTTLIIIIFTTFIQGTSLKPIIKRKICNFKKDKKEKDTVFKEINKRVIDNFMTGIELLIGRHGKNRFRTWIFRINDQYMRRWLQNDPRTHNQRIIEVYQQTSLKEYEMSLHDGSGIVTGSNISKLPVVGPTSEVNDFKRRNQNKSRVGRVMNRIFKPESLPVDILTADDVRKLLSSANNNSAGYLHRKYDPKLEFDDKEDMTCQLREKRMRVSRLVRFRRCGGVSQDASKRQGHAGEITIGTSTCPDSTNNKAEVDLEMMPDSQVVEIDTLKVVVDEEEV